MKYLDQFVGGAFVWSMVIVSGTTAVPAYAQRDPDIKISAEERDERKKQADAEVRRRKDTLRKQIAELETQKDGINSGLQSEGEQVEAFRAGLSHAETAVQYANNQAIQCGSGYQCMGYFNTAQNVTNAYNEAVQKFNYALNTYNNRVNRVNSLNKRIESLEQDLRNLD
jgi:DNA repair exonuclease SbcCD ATPase subunit